MHKLPRRSSIVTLVVIAVAVGVILSCASDGKHLKHCYAITEGATVTTLVIEEGPPSLLTVYEKENGKDVVPPATFEVTMDGNAFKFADGTRVLFDDQKLTGAGVFAELVFHKTDCPPE